MSFFPLQDQEVLLATEDGFLSTYLRTAFQTWGIKVGPAIQSADDLIRRVDHGATPVAACVSVNLPGLSTELRDKFAERGIPFVLVGIPNSPPALLASVAIAWPFSAFQLATDLSTLVERGHAAAGGAAAAS